MADPTAQPTDSDALNLKVLGIVQLKPQGADSNYLDWSFVVLLHLKSLKLAYVLDPVDTTATDAKPLPTSWANDSIAVSSFIAVERKARPRIFLVLLRSATRLAPANTRFTPKSLCFSDMFRVLSSPLPPLFCLEVHSSSVSHTPVPSCFPRCHPLSPPRTPRVTPPTPVGPGTPPAAPKQVSHRRFRLWSAPNPASAPRCSPLLVAPPQYTLNPRSAVGRDPRRPPMPGFPAPAYVASAPRAFRISAASIPHAPNKPAKALVQARSRHHIPPTLKILSPGSSSPPTSIPVSHLPTMSTCSNCQSRNTTCVRESSNHACDFCRKAKPSSDYYPRKLFGRFCRADSASVSVASPTPSSRPPSPPPQPPQSSPESPAGSDQMTPRPHESNFSSRPEYRAALCNWTSRHHVTQPLYDERLRRPASSPRRGSPRHSPLRRSPCRISDSPVPPSAPAADLQVVPRRPTPARALSPTPIRSPVPANTTIDIEPIVISSGPPSPSSQSPVIRSTPVSPMHVDPEPEILHPTPPPSVGAAPNHTTPNSSPRYPLTV
ncbi:hypothetical protein PGTUg99_022316 [Puccinia graminis f. sp. tritici]|uniref:Uncharacterized protein n=1 Tax=Puccinia graminis f. sp. tritici TaxID=56615 RepID=A0A5B0SJ68_PUCGR|nr:hypothetical protein PGTUg99_022316 [Puccinia graminis f. sp. tritici]